MNRPVPSRSCWVLLVAIFFLSFSIVSWKSETQRTLLDKIRYKPVTADRVVTPPPTHAPSTHGRPPATRPAPRPAPAANIQPATGPQSTPKAQSAPPTALQASMADSLPDPYRPELVMYDWKETSEEIECRRNHSSQIKAPVPRVVHFVLISRPGKKASLRYKEFLAIKAAKLRVRPDKIKIHTHEIDADNEYWQQLKGHVEVVFHDRNALPPPNNQSMDNIPLAHQSDMLRIDILLKEGGIYLDTDVYALKPFSHLLTNPKDVLLGHEGADRKALCNGVIIARPNNDFMQRWQEEYVTYSPAAWNYHSVLVPKWLQMEYPDLVCPLAPHIFFWPTYRPEHVAYMHETLNQTGKAELLKNMTAYGGTMYPDQLACHGWGAVAPRLQTLTLQDVLEKDTRFNILLRDIAKAPL